MAETFNNGESNASIRAKLNANAEEINDQAIEIEVLDTIKAPKSNPTFTGTVAGVTKAMVGLSNVDNTADASKPVSTLQQNALDAKAPIASPTFTGTVGGITKSMVGLGSVDNTADASKPVSIAQAAAINARVPNTRTVNSKPLSTDITLDKTDIGLSNVDNTSDINKPISALTQNALDLKASTDAGSLVTGTLNDSRLSENVPIKVDGLILSTDLPNALLNGDQFETLIDGTIGIKTSYLESLGLGGLPTPTAPTVTVSGRNVSAIHPSYPDKLELSTDNGAWGDYTDSDPIPVGVDEVLSNYYRFRVKAESGVNNAGSIAGNPYIASDSGSYVVENTYLVNFGSEFGGYPDTPPPYFNNLKPSNSLIEADNGFTSPVLVNTSNAASTITVTNSGAFSGSTGQISAEQDAAGNTGVFQNEAVNTAWSLNGSTSAMLLFENLTSGKYYQIYALMPVSNADSVRGITIGATTKNKTATTILGSFGQAANGLNDPEWIVFNNITGVTELEMAVNRVSGDFGAFLAMIVIEQSNIAKP